jgi:hypothetical protein
MVYAGDEGTDCESVQRKKLTQRLRKDGRSLKAFWEDALRDFGGKVTASQLQARIDQEVGEEGGQGCKGKGVVSSFFCEEECELSYDDVYDVLVCL